MSPPSNLSKSVVVNSQPPPAGTTSPGRQPHHLRVIAITANLYTEHSTPLHLTGELGWGVAAGCAGFLPARQGRHRQRARACRGRGVGRGFAGEGRGNGGPGCGRSREVGWRRCGTSLGKGSQRQSCVVGRGRRGRRIWSRRARWEQDPRRERGRRLRQQRGGERGAG